MPEFQLSPLAQQWANVVLLWLGFGILTGLLARALVPGPQPAGAIGTLLIGVLGGVAGPLALSALLKRTDFNPISPLGLLASVGGAVILLIGCRFLGVFFRSAAADDGAD